MDRFRSDEDEIMEKIFAHSKLIKGSGKSLRHLKISELNLKLESLQTADDEEKLEDIFGGNHLESLLANCPSLINLTVLNSYLIVPTTSTSVLHHSLEELSIRKSKVDPKILTQLSTRLSSLKKLSLSQFVLPYRFTVTHRKRSMQTHMPNTSFDSIYCYDKVQFDAKNDSDNPLHSFFIQLKTDAEEDVQYYSYNDRTKIN